MGRSSVLAARATGFEGRPGPGDARASNTHGILLGVRTPGGSRFSVKVLTERCLPSTRRISRCRYLMPAVVQDVSPLPARSSPAGAACPGSPSSRPSAGAAARTGPTERRPPRSGCVRRAPARPRSPPAGGPYTPTPNPGSWTGSRGARPAMPSVGISPDRDWSRSTLPRRLGNTMPPGTAAVESARSRRACCRTSTARLHSGTRCSRADFIRDAGIAQTRLSRSISSHAASRTSADRAAVSTRNSKASFTPVHAVECTERHARRCGRRTGQ